MSRTGETSEKVDIFLPCEYQPSNIDVQIQKLLSITKKKFSYASKGRYAIGHVINSFKLNPRDTVVLISPYMCPTVKKRIIDMGYKVDYFDIDIRDLNPSPASIEKAIINTNAKVVVAASLYGNPADLTTIESICKKYRVYLIDDCAQSFGAQLEGRFIGTFGNGGVFSFSPGKATSGHMGALFWTDNHYVIQRTRNFLVHKISYLNFYYNREKIYTNKFIKLTRILSYMSGFLEKYINIENDDIESFEKNILGGILNANLDGTLDYRTDIFNKFAKMFDKNSAFRIICAIRGKPNPHKIVLIFSNIKEASKFKKFMFERNIFTYGGYSISEDCCKYNEGCKLINGCVVELPIENNKNRMDYMMNCVRIYIETLRRKKYDKE